MSLLRRRRIHPFPFDETNKNSKPQEEEDDHGVFYSDDKKGKGLYKHEEEEENKSAAPKRASCLDTWCWLFGCVCVTWWLVLLFYNVMPASFPKYVTEVITGTLPDPPGVKLRKLGLKAKHPVVFVPAEVTGGLELWEGRKCAQGLFRKRIWSGTSCEVHMRRKCWVEHMSLDDETGLDPIGIRVRPVSGLVSADDLGSGYFVWETLVYNLASIGYEGKTMFMAAYDWRLSFQNTQVRDQTLSRMKHNIELMVATSGGQKAVIIPHSMGALYFLHFMKWVETPAPMGGGGGGPDWCSKHIKAVVNIAAPFLGVPKAIPLLFSAEAKDNAIFRTIAPSFIEKDIFRLQTLQHVMKLSRSWDSIMSLIPRGGNTIWGGLDWSPEEGYSCGGRKGEPKNGTQVAGHAGSTIYQTRSANYGRIISFGKDVAEAPSYDDDRIEFKGAAKGHSAVNRTCRDSWTEYHDMGSGDIKAVADYKTYTAKSIVDLLHFVAPRMMARGTAHFSYGIADNLDDPKYKHYKYWSNPLETTLPNAPDMEIFSLYGVGLPTERAYVYKSSPAAECNIPFRIDSSAADEDTCLKDGVYSVDRDETVPVISAGFMCAKAWHGKTRFNPSGVRTYIREYRHSPPTTLLEGRGTLSGGHVDIMGNFALIEDVLRIAAGASGEELGGNRVHSNIIKWSEKINLQL